MRRLVGGCVLLLATLPLLAQNRADGTALLESNKCFDCHRVGERGSRVGPDLSDIGARRSADQLRQAILSPDSEVLPQYRSVRIVTKDGASVIGRLLNQDAFSIQLMTIDEQLKSYAKSGVRELTILDKGLMPSYEGKLSAQQIAEIVSYLGSLKGGDIVANRASSTAAGGMTHDRLLHPEREPQNWLTYGGSYASQRYSLLSAITRDNVRQLTLKWVWRPKYLDKMETTPLVVDGVLYTVQNSEVVAMDAATGRTYWTFRYRVPPESNAYLMVVKGLAISGDRLFWATYDGHLIAIDAKTGTAIWNRTLLDYKKGLQLNVAPLVIKDKVILGPSTNEFGTNCWIAAYDARTGSEVWRFNTVPGPGERGNETWPGDSWCSQEDATATSSRSMRARASCCGK
jgi:putative heme-binding domain-containing protein